MRGKGVRRYSAGRGGAPASRTCTSAPPGHCIDTSAGRYRGRAVKVKGGEEIVHNTEACEVAQEGGTGIVVFAHSDLAKAVEHAGTVDGSVVLDRETRTIVHPAPEAPAADLNKAEAPA
ncbi:hypothetical protein AB0C70_42565 [Streptomyces sp. NPDC048564]|uniref:hypothetical protein n=1 Tax=Streptomyces sp. NPDC048564 TaxID=3155760 RepID=UPI00342D48D8